MYLEIRNVLLVKIKNVLLKSNISSILEEAVMQKQFLTFKTII